MSVFCSVFISYQYLSCTETSTGASLWGPLDPVHLTAEAYLEVANAVLQEGASSDLRAGKRPRLDSVVPGPPSKRGRGPKVNPSPWVTGSSSARGNPNRRGRGGWSSTTAGGFASRGHGRGRAFTRGGYRGRFNGPRRGFYGR